MAGGAGAAAQELDPRAYAPNPTGANFLLLVYSYSTGDVVFDPSLPFTNVEARVNGLALAYGRTFGLFGHSASASPAAPYARGPISGDIGEMTRSVRRSGLADLKGRLALNLIGGPALAPKEFAQTPLHPTLGASLSFSAPTGQYDPAKLINISTNRWIFKPEVGFSHP